MRSAVGDLLVTVVVSTYLAASVCATKILLVPGNLDSHVILFSRLGVELAKLGDVVTVIAPSSTRIPDFVADDIENFTYLSYPVDKSAWFANKTETLIARAMISSSPIQVMRMFAEGTAAVTRVGEQNCIRLLDNAKIMPKIRTAGYDFAIMDMYGAIACYYTIRTRWEYPTQRCRSLYLQPVSFASHAWRHFRIWPVSAIEQVFSIDLQHSS